MCKIIGLAVAMTIAAMGSTLCNKSAEVAAHSEAVATTVRVLPFDILQSQVRGLLLK